MIMSKHGTACVYWCKYKWHQAALMETFRWCHIMDLIV